MARAATRAIVIWGAGYDTSSAQGDLLNGIDEVRQTGCRIKTVSIRSVLSPQRMSAERKQTPQVVENLRNRRIVWRVPA